MDDPSDLGKHRAAIIALVNEHLRNRHPRVGQHPAPELSIGIKDYSDLKIEAAHRLDTVHAAGA